MPGGDDRIKLARLLNEIQMTLHSALINEQRQRQKLLPINSLWFWGYGSLPETTERRWSFIAGDESLAKGLALLAEIPFQPVPGHYEQLEHAPENGSGLVVTQRPAKVQRLSGSGGWLAALPEYEKNWFCRCNGP